MSPVESSTPRAVRCAIYTRKSTEEGLSQEFNSLDAQRECAQAYILSQRQQGWTLLPEHYDDGGFSGANLARPALQRLLADIQAGKIDCRDLQSGSAEPLAIRLCASHADPGEAPVSYTHLTLPTIYSV